MFRWRLGLVVVHAQIVQLWVREEMILQQTCWERGMGLTSRHADEWDQWALHMLHHVPVWLTHRLGLCDSDMVTWRWMLRTRSHACEDIDWHAVENR